MENKTNSINELIKDEYFIQCVVDIISELREKRYKREKPKAGYRYARDWYDRMSESHTFTREYFINNIMDIWNKKSNLSSEVRSVIKYVCDKAAISTFEYYESKKTLNEPS
jgi:hypothetical protein